MDKYFLKAITIIAAGAFMSCNKGDVENLSAEGKKEVVFSSNIVKEIPATRASGSTWHSGDSIGVFMLEENSTNIVEEKSNIKYITENENARGQFSASTNIIYFPDNGKKVRFMAYYPYTTTLDGDIYKVDVSKQDNQSLIDLLYSFNTTKMYDKTTPEKKVNLVFDHKLTKIRINVLAGEGVQDADLSNLTVSFEDFYTKADFDLITGVLATYSDEASITAAKTAAAKEGFIASYEAIVLPTGPGKNIKFDLGEKDGANNVFTWSFNSALIEGSEYVYNVTIKRSGIVVEATINPWKEEKEQNIAAE